MGSSLSFISSAVMGQYGLWTPQKKALRVLSLPKKVKAGADVGFRSEGRRRERIPYFSLCRWLLA